MSRKIGLCLIGAYGAISTSVILGINALRKKLIDTTGLLTVNPHLNSLPLLKWEDLVVCGFDIKKSTFKKSVDLLIKSCQTLGDINLDSSISELSFDITVMRGFDYSPKSRNIKYSKLFEEASKKLEGFCNKNQLDDLVIVNLASTEVYTDIPHYAESLNSLEKAIEESDVYIPPSILYAYVAISRGFPYINFTPSIGSSIKAIDELAHKCRTVHYGKDGKTGETLIKSALAPLFKNRNLKVLSWSGYNMLGGGDGRILKEKENKETKIKDKDKVLLSLFGGAVSPNTEISYNPSLGNWKIAWDFIQFEGFLNTKMSFQFTWQGCDPILAAPLVLDLVRLSEYSHRIGEKGAMKHLACFFKNPYDVEEQDFYRQFDGLIRYVNRRL